MDTNNKLKVHVYVNNGEVWINRNNLVDWLKETQKLNGGSTQILDMLIAKLESFPGTEEI